jgi:hypothetical protein
MKNQQKEKTKARKKKKILTKLVVGREDKGFDVVECQLINDTLGNKFLGCFPFGNDSLSGVTIKVHHFKRARANIVYRPFLDIHKDDIKKRIVQYNKFDIFL